MPYQSWNDMNDITHHTAPFALAKTDKLNNQNLMTKIAHLGIILQLKKSNIDYIVWSALAFWNIIVLKSQLWFF